MLFAHLDGPRVAQWTEIVEANNLKFDWWVETTRFISLGTCDRIRRSQIDDETAESVSANIILISQSI